MLYLLDTNAVSDVISEHPNVTRRMAALPISHRVIICSIVRGELLFGIERLPAGKRREQLREKAELVLPGFPCEPVGPAAGDLYARIKRGRQLAGIPMDENDLWIAATALALGAVLVTRDQDFGGTPGLAIEDWAA